MKTFLKLFILFSFITVFSSCQKEFSSDNPVTIYDSDAKAFLSAGKIIDDTRKIAINNLVTQLKEDSLWNRFLAIYPMIGGTPQTTMLNLKDPRDLDAAYRITWNGTPDFADSGVTCMNETDWGDTHLADTLLSFNNAAISFYSGTENTVGGYDMGCTNNTHPYNILSIYEDYSNDVANTWFYQYNSSQYKPSTTRGLFINSSLGDSVVFYRNGVATSTFSAGHNEYTKVSITIGKVTDDPFMGKRTCQLATIGQGLTPEQAANFYKISKAFQAALGR